METFNDDTLKFRLLLQEARLFLRPYYTIMSKDEWQFKSEVNSKILKP